MHIRLRFTLFVLSLLLVVSAGALSSTATAQTPGDNSQASPNTIFLPLVHQAAAAQATIDPRVLEDTANGQTGHFLVVLSQQAQSRALASRRAIAPPRGAWSLTRCARSRQPGAGARAAGCAGRPISRLLGRQSAGRQGNRAVVEAMAARPDVLAIESDRAFSVALETERSRSAPRP